MLIMVYAQSNAERLYAEYRYAECRYVECWGVSQLPTVEKKILFDQQSWRHLKLCFE